MAEFIAAKDLPTTEEEEVDVLCVNPTTGEMCRKANTSFSGNGNEYDMLIRFSLGASNVSNFARFEYGAPQGIVDKLKNGEIPKIAIAGYFYGDTISHINRLVDARDIESNSFSIKLDVINEYVDTWGFYITIVLSSSESNFYQNYGDGTGVAETLQIVAAS